MKTPSKFNRISSKRNKIIALIVVLLVAISGYAFVMSRASGFFIVVSPTTATLTSNAKIITESDGSKVIQFTAPVAPPPTTPPVTPPSTGERVCPAFPAMPDDSCAGIPAGISLSTVNGNLSTTSDGQIIEGKLITGEVIISHDNVTIKNSRIKGPILYQTSGKNNKGLVIKDSDIGPDACPANSNGGTRLIRGDDYTLLRSRVHNNGADMISLYGSASGTGTILIQDNILDKTCFYNDDHLDAIQLYDPGSVAKVNIIHNRIDARPVNSGGNGNAAVFWADNPGSGSRLTMYHNLFAGGNYTVYLLDASANSGVIIDGHDNLFTKGAYTYGPCTSDVSIAFNGTAGLKWANNKFTDGTPISC